MITIPTIQELYAEEVAAIESEFGDAMPLFGKVFLRALAAARGAIRWLIYIRIAKLQKNIFVDTADPESSGGTLERFGRVKLNRDPFPARAGVYTLEVTGNVGATIAAKTVFKSDDENANPGKLFILDSSYTLVATTDEITVRALEAGLDSKLNIGETLTATAPIIGVNQSAEVTAETTEPQAAEDIEDYRAKVIDAYRLEPQGGAATDYRLWAFDAQGVKQVYPYAKSGSAGEIDVFVEATIADSTDNHGTPSAQLLVDVADVIEFDPDTTRPLNERGRRPLGVFALNVKPVTPLKVDITVSSYSNLTANKQAAIEAALADLVNGIRPFVAAADILEDRNDLLDSNRIVAAILNAVPGSSFGAITIAIDNSIVSSQLFTQGNIPYYNSVTFV